MAWWDYLSTIDYGLLKAQDFEAETEPETSPLVQRAMEELRRRVDRESMALYDDSKRASTLWDSLSADWAPEEKTEERRQEFIQRTLGQERLAEYTEQFVPTERRPGIEALRMQGMAGETPDVSPLESLGKRAEDVGAEGLAGQVQTDRERIEEVAAELEERVASKKESILSWLQMGTISEGNAEALYSQATDHALKEMFPEGKTRSRFGFDLSDIGLGRFMGKQITLDDVFELEKYLGRKLITPLLPEEFYKPIEEVPVIGHEAAEITRGLTTPVGLAATAAFPAITAQMVAGELGGYAVGKGIEAGMEKAGLPTTKEIAGVNVGPAGVLQTKGALLAPAFGPKLAATLSRRAYAQLAGKGTEVIRPAAEAAQMGLRATVAPESVQRAAGVAVGKTPGQLAGEQFERGIGRFARGIAEERGGIKIPGGEPPPSFPRERITIKVGDINYKPEMFQARDADPGSAVSARRVNQLVEGWDPAQYSPPHLVRDAQTGELILYRGHHRTAAYRQIHGPEQTTEAYVVKADLNNPDHVARLMLEGDASNFKTALPNFRESVRTVARAETVGKSVEEIGVLLRKSPGEVQALQDAGRLGAAVIDRVVAEPVLGPYAAELGRGVRVYGIRTEEAAAWFKRIADAPKGQRPTQTAVRDTVDKFGRRLSEVPPQMFGGFEGMEGSRGGILEAMDQNARLRSDLQKQVNRVKRTQTQVDKLREAPGVTEVDVQALETTVNVAKREQTRLEAEIVRNNEDVMGALRQAQEGMPAAAISEAERGAAPITEAISTLERPQVVPSQVSVQSVVPSETTRATALPTQEGLTTTLRELGVTINDPSSPRPILTQIGTIDEGIRMAEEVERTFIKPFIQQVRSARPAWGRLKGHQRLGEKLTEGRQANEISDYYAHRFVAQDAAALDQTIREIAANYKIIQGRSVPAGEGRMPMVNLDVQMPNGLSVEIQLLLPRYAAVQEVSHIYYEALRVPTASSALRERAQRAINYLVDNAQEVSIEDAIRLNKLVKASADDPILRPVAENARRIFNGEEPTILRGFMAEGGMVQESAFTTERGMWGITEEQGRLGLQPGERPIPALEAAAPEWHPWRLSHKAEKVGDELVLKNPQGEIIGRQPYNPKMAMGNQEGALQTEVYRRLFPETVPTAPARPAAATAPEAATGEGRLAAAWVSGDVSPAEIAQTARGEVPARFREVERTVQKIEADLKALRETAAPAGLEPQTQVRIAQLERELAGAKGTEFARARMLTRAQEAAPSPPTPRTNEQVIRGWQEMSQKPRAASTAGETAPGGVGAGRRPPPPADRPPVDPSVYDTPPSMDLWRTLEREHITGPGAQNTLRWLAEKLADKNPLIAKLVRTTAGPAAVARMDTPRRAGVVYRLMEEITDAQRELRMAWFEGSNPFMRGKNPAEVLIKGRSVAFADVAENPARFTLNAEQRGWIEKGWKWIDEWADHYERILGKPIKAPAEVEGLIPGIAKRVREHYWPRFAKDNEGRAYIRAAIGVRQTPAKKRVFDTMTEGIREGVPYASPIESLSLYVRSMNKMVRDELLRQVVRKDGIGRTVTERLEQVINAARKQVWEAATPEERAVANERMNRLLEAKNRIAATGREEVAGIYVGPGLSGTVFTKETADALKGVVGKGSRWLFPFQQAAAVPRLLVTGLADVGHFFIQLLPLLTKPEAWASAVGRSVQAMVKPKDYLMWLAKSPAARRAVQYGVDVSGSEFTEAARGPGLLAKMPSQLKVIPRGFDSALSVGRINLFDALADIAVRKGGTGQLYRLGRYVNTMLGAPSVRGLGISTTQRQFEGAFVFYSPRYTRSILGATAYMFGNGFLASEARMTLSKMLLGGAATFYGIGKVAGLSDEEILHRLNPQSRGKFLSVPIGGEEVGIGSAYRSFLGFLGSLTVYDNWKFDSWSEAAQFNPIVRFLRSRAAPGPTSTLIDFIFEEDYLGVPIDPFMLFTDPGRTLDYAGDKFLPLNVEAVLEADSWMDKLVAGVVETFGGRAYPRSPWDRLNELSRRYDPEGRDFWDMNEVERDQMERDHADVAYQLERCSQRGIQRKDPVALASKQYEQYQEGLEEQKLLAVLDNPQATGNDFRENLSDVKRELAIRGDTLFGEMEGGDPHHPMDKAARQYDRVELKWPGGKADYDSYFAEKEEIIQAQPDPKAFEQYLRQREETRWINRRIGDFALAVDHASEIGREYYTIPYKFGFTPEEDRKMRVEVSKVQAYANLNQINKQQAIRQMDYTPREQYDILTWINSPENKERAVWKKDNREDWNWYLMFYSDVPLSEIKEPVALSTPR